MSFLAPGFAFLTLLFAVPIAIHLIGRSRAKVRRFAAIELLMRSDKRVARRTKIRQRLLLLLRALAIAAVPLILAKPFFEAASTDLPATAVGGAQSAVLVLDDSMSMSAEHKGQTLVEAARTRARRIVEALGPRLRRGDRARVARRRRAGAAALRRSQQARPRHHRRAPDLPSN